MYILKLDHSVNVHAKDLMFSCFRLFSSWYVFPMKSMKSLKSFLYVIFLRKSVKFQTEIHQLLAFSYASCFSQILVVLFWIRQKWYWAEPTKSLKQAFLLIKVFSKVLFWDSINHLSRNTRIKAFARFCLEV